MINNKYIMNEQDKIKEELIRKQIEKICQKNPDSVPVYYILSSKDQTKVPQDWPVIFVSKKMLLREVIDRLKQKVKQYSYIYIFGKDRSQEIRLSEMSLKQKRKHRGKAEFYENVQKLVNLDESLLNVSVGQTHQRYKDNNNLLVVIMSTQQLQKPKKKKRDTKQILFIAVCIISISFYIYLLLTSKADTAQMELSGNAKTTQM